MTSEPSSPPYIDWQPEDYSRAIQTSSHILQLVDSAYKRLRIDEYGQQITLARNYIWVAMSIVTAAVALIGQKQVIAILTHEATSPVLWVCLALCLLAIVLCVIAIFQCTGIGHGTNSLNYINDIDNMFYQLDDKGERLCVKNPDMPFLYGAHLQAIFDLKEAYSFFEKQKHQKGLKLRRIGGLIRLAITLLVFSYLLYLTELFYGL